MRRSFLVILSALVLGLGGYLWFRPQVQPAVLSHFQIAADHELFCFSEEHDRESVAFRVDWPPKDPSDDRGRRSMPLLEGEFVASAGKEKGRPQLNVRIELTRPDSEKDRQRWNRDLKFPEYDWMSRVRVWDREQKWLWPNLPYLLRVHGVERQQRYGGIDPGKGIDNDFAAILIRPLNSSPEDVPQVTAEWHGPKGGFVDRRSVVHKAISDDLLWPIPRSTESGELGVWLIYADFLNFDPPDTWPSEPEYDGGVLAYFSLRWQVIENGQVEIIGVSNEAPPAPTGIDWQAWLNENQNDG